MLSKPDAKLVLQAEFVVDVDFAPPDRVEELPNVPSKFVRSHRFMSSRMQH